MNRISESKTVLYIFTDIIQAKEINVDTLEQKKLPVNNMKRGSRVPVVSDNGHIKEYYVDAIELQSNNSQLILHVKLMPL